VSCNPSDVITRSRLRLVSNTFAPVARWLSCFLHGCCRSTHRQHPTILRSAARLAAGPRLHTFCGFSCPLSLAPACSPGNLVFVLCMGF